MHIHHTGFADIFSVACPAPAQRLVFLANPRCHFLSLKRQTSTMVISTMPPSTLSKSMGTQVNDSHVLQIHLKQQFIQLPRVMGYRHSQARPRVIFCLNVVASSRQLHSSQDPKKHYEADKALPQATVRRTKLVLHAQEVQYNASAGNRARVTSMATMYSTTRPLMPWLPAGALENNAHDPAQPGVEGESGPLPQGYAAGTAETV